MTALPVIVITWRKTILPRVGGMTRMARGQSTPVAAQSLHKSDSPSTIEGHRWFFSGWQHNLNQDR